MRVHRATSAVAAACTLLLSACGIGADDTPRDIPAQNQLSLDGDSDTQAGAATGTARVYLLAPEASGQAVALTSVARDVSETADNVLAALLAGPNSEELARQYRTSLPANLDLHSTSRRGSVLVIDVSDDLLQLSGQALVLAVAQIVFTASELPSVRSVQLLVDGAEQQWPAGNGETRSEPLTVYDYPGLVQSSQPAYPAIPTPPQG